MWLNIVYWIKCINVWECFIEGGAPCPFGFMESLLFWWHSKLHRIVEAARQERALERWSWRYFSHAVYVTWELNLERKLLSFQIGFPYKTFSNTTKSELLFDISSGRCFIKKYLSSGLTSRVFGMTCLQRSIPPLLLAICFCLDVSLTSVKSGHPS